MGSPHVHAPPYQVHMDPDAARGLAEQGGTVLMLGVPPGSYVGVDQQVFAAGPKFKGIKMIPPGPHFFSCTATATSGPAAGAVAPPTGFFLHVAPRQVVVKVWDAATEQLVDMRDADEAQRYAEGVRRFEFDSYLAPYDLSRYQQWTRISSLITPLVIEAVSPVGGSISISAEADDPELLDPKTEAERKLVEQLQEGRARITERLQRLQLQGQAEGQQGQEGQAEGAEVVDMAVDQAPTSVSAAGPSSSGQGVPAAAPAADTASTAPSAAMASGVATDTAGMASDAAGTASDVAGTAPDAAAAAGDTAAAAAGASPDAAAAAAAQHGAAERRRRTGRCFYTHLPRLVKQRGLSAAQLTALNLDKSAQLLQAVQERYGGDVEALLGEMQYAFVAFVFGQSLDGFSQVSGCKGEEVGVAGAGMHYTLCYLYAAAAAGWLPSPAAVAAAAAICLPSLAAAVAAAAAAANRPPSPATAAAAAVVACRCAVEITADAAPGLRGRPLAHPSGRVRQGTTSHQSAAVGDARRQLPLGIRSGGGNRGGAGPRGHGRGGGGRGGGGGGAG